MRALILLALVACAPALAPATPRAVALGDGVGVYVSAPRAFTTNSFWIAGPEGTVLVDTQFTPSEALAAMDAAERATGQQVTHALVLHANPDKFNGTPALQARGVEVLTAASVAAAIPAIDTQRRRWFEARYAPDYPATTPAPDPFPDDTGVLSIAGLRLRVWVLGQGVSRAQLVAEHRGHLFVGDLVTNAHHAWMELGDLDAWRARLRELEALAPRWVHPGRGPSAGPELFDRQRAYFDTVEAIVRADPQSTIGALRARVEAAFPDHGHPVFLRVGLPAVRDTIADTLAGTGLATTRSPGRPTPAWRRLAWRAGKPVGFERQPSAWMETTPPALRAWCRASPGASAPFVCS